MNEEERIERRLNDHAERIRLLEIRDAAQNEKIEMLCNKLDNLSDKIDDWMTFVKEVLWKFLGIGGTIFLVFLGFFIWYIQSLPR